jgi:hypothetical protein
MQGDEALFAVSVGRSVAGAKTQANELVDLEGHNKNQVVQGTRIIESVVFP